MKVSVSGLIDARRAFARLSEKHRELIVEVHTQSASAIVRAASSRVRQKSGLLARSIQFVVSDRTGAAKVGITKGPAYYGHFIEFGTVRMRPRPFMMPSVEEERGRIEARFMEGGKRLERGLTGGRFL